MTTPQRNSWGDFYEGAGSADYLLDHLAIHKDFLKEIFGRKPVTALEAGCGSAIMSVFLAMTGVRVTACDRDPEVLRKAGETARQWNAMVTFAKEDLLALSLGADRFDLSFSQGVLEHMTDEQIRQSCREILRVSPVFVFSVPSVYYNHQDFGDERLLPESEWRRILNGIGRLELKPYFPLRVKRNFLVKRPLMLMGILTR
jgi:2-polyprenyl-3-methyl-5-hydroxy-6-metoxy-1,4-benzoquinol methylase